MKLIEWINIKFNINKQNYLVSLSLILLTFSHVSYAGFTITIHRQSNFNMLAMLSALLLMIAFFMYSSRKEQI